VYPDPALGAPLASNVTPPITRSPAVTDARLTVGPALLPVAVLVTSRAGVVPTGGVNSAQAILNSFGPPVVVTVTLYAAFAVIPKA